jgi:hypothetical protein
MSNTNLLRKTHTNFGGGRTIFSKDAKTIEAKMASVVVYVIQQLKANYPEMDFQWHKNIRKDSDYYDLEGYTLQNKSASIRPDGGMITADNVPIFFGEVKNQGTNHIRIKEGLPRQSMGNGIERIYKNIVEIQHIMKKYSFMPYVIFVQGSDFHEGSSIIDRLSMLAPFNVFKIESTLPSVFVNINKNWKNDPILWTAEQMFNISYAACQESLRCISKNK